MDDLDDDYVAKLLAEDAKKTSSRYAKQGLSGFHSQRRAPNALRPNTKFLQTIVREADQHNTALRKREEIEARVRLRELREGSAKGQQERHSSHHRKRRRLSDDQLARGHQSRSDDDRRGRHRRRELDRLQRDSLDVCTRIGSIGPVRDVPFYDRSRSPRESRASDLQSTFRSATPLDSVDSTRIPRKNEVQIRGRGAQSGTETYVSNIDNHFSTSYDPSEDVRSSSEREQDGGDWDMALDALRDRAKWKKNQGSRMRDVGFSSREIESWQKGFSNSDEREKDPGELRWSKRGQTREWDHDKAEQ